MQRLTMRQTMDPIVDSKVKNGAMVAISTAIAPVNEPSNGQPLPRFTVSVAFIEWPPNGLNNYDK